MQKSVASPVPRSSRPREGRHHLYGGEMARTFRSATRTYMSLNPGLPQPRSFAPPPCDPFDAAETDHRGETAGVRGCPRRARGGVMAPAQQWHGGAHKSKGCVTAACRRTPSHLTSSSPIRSPSGPTAPPSGSRHACSLRRPWMRVKLTGERVVIGKPTTARGAAAHESRARRSGMKGERWAPLPIEGSNASGPLRR
jgi:hypothetical protein